MSYFRGCNLKAFIHLTVERKRLHWHFYLGKDSFFPNWDRLLVGCCFCDLYLCGYIKSRTILSVTSLVCSHSVPWGDVAFWLLASFLWYRASHEEMRCFSCWRVSGHGLAMVRVWREAIEWVVVNTRLGPCCLLRVSTWVFSRPDRPRAWTDVG